MDLLNDFSLSRSASPAELSRLRDRSDGSDSDTQDLTDSKKFLSAEELLSLLTAAERSLDLLLQLVPSEYGPFLRSDDGQRCSEPLRKLVMSLASIDARNETWSVAGWQSLVPASRRSLTRLICQLAVFNEAYIRTLRADHDSLQLFPREGDRHGADEPSTQPTIGECLDNLQTKFERLLARLRRPAVSQTERAVTLAYIVLSIFTTAVGWYAVAVHVLMQRPVTAAITWMLMVVPELLVLRKESVGERWLCSCRRFIMQLLFPYKLTGGLVRSWLLSTKRRPLPAESTSLDLESGRWTKTEIDPAHLDYLSLKNRHLRDLEQAMDIILLVKLGFMPLFVLHVYLLIDEVILELGWTANQHGCLIPPVVIYLLSAVAGCTAALASTYLTCRPTPYVYKIGPRLKLGMGLLLCLVSRTFYLVTLLRLSPSWMPVCLLLAISTVNAFFVLKSQRIPFGATLFDSMSMLDQFRYLSYLVFLTIIRIYQPHMIAPNRTNAYNWLHFAWDFLQVLAFATVGLGLFGHWKFIYGTMLLWVYLAGCALQAWAFLRFIPGAPRKEFEESRKEVVYLSYGQFSVGRAPTKRNRRRLKSSGAR